MAVRLLASTSQGRSLGVIWAISLLVLLARCSRENQVYDSGFSAVVAWAIRFVRPFEQERRAALPRGYAVFDETMHLLVFFILITGGKRIEHQEAVVGVAVIDDPALQFAVELGGIDLC